MIVLMLEHVTPSLRGELTRWMLEPRPGVFVGKLSALVRDRLWDYIQQKAPRGAGMLVHNAQNEQGFVIRTFGQTKRDVVDFEGLTLIRQPGEHKRVKAGKRLD